MSTEITQPRNLHKRKSLFPIVYIILLAFAFCSRLGNYIMPSKVQLMISSGLLAIVLINIWLGISRNRKTDFSDAKWMLKVYLLPHVFLHLYTIFLMIIGKVSWSDLTTSASVYIPTLLAICSIHLFKEKAFKYISVSLIGSWGLAVFLGVMTKGFRIFSHAIIQGYIDPSHRTPGLYGNYLELHDLVLAAAYIAIFYIFAQKKLTKLDFAILSMASLIMLLGIKRISIIGLILVTIFHIVVRWLPEKGQYRVCLIAGWAGFLFCFFFIYWMSIPGAFAEFVSEHGINTMSRVDFYEEIMKLAEFSPSFMGIGRHVLTRVMKEGTIHPIVRAAHSDVIKMYVENGFIVFGIWLWYYLINVTKQYKNRFSINEAVFYFGLTIYTFTLYLTDNNETYFICQMFSIITPAAYALSRRRQVEEGVRGED